MIYVGYRPNYRYLIEVTAEDVQDSIAEYHLRMVRGGYFSYFRQTVYDLLMAGF